MNIYKRMELKVAKYDENRILGSLGFPKSLEVVKVEYSDF